MSKDRFNLRQSLLRWLKGIGSLPGLVAEALKRRRRQSALDDLEAERLDRIRNPSKYRGK